MEVDRAVLVCRMPEAHLATRPSGSGHGAGRQAHEPAVAGVGPDVGDAEGIEISGKIPTCDETGRAGAARQGRLDGINWQGG